VTAPPLAAVAVPPEANYSSSAAPRVTTELAAALAPLCWLSPNTPRRSAVRPRCSLSAAVDVAEPPELFRLECASPRYTADTNSTHSKRNNPLVCRVSARCNHSSTGSNQVYLARRRVYSRTTAHQFLIHSILNIITNRFKFKVINKHYLKRQAKQLVQVHSGSKINARLYSSWR
jgi:hypothetical protein